MARQEQNTNRLPVSIVIPTLDAAACLPATLRSLGGVNEVIAVDGGSTDGTPDLARSLGCRVVRAPRGRGCQLAAGVAAASQDWLLLLHADTRLQPGWAGHAARHMRDSGSAGYFRFALDSSDPRARRLERLVALRCRLLALPYGDQGLLVHRALLAQAGGVPPLPLMEDVALVRRLGRRRLAAIDAAAITAAAKWERDGWLLRSARNLFCLGLWFAGVPPQRILRLYR
jgi:rSAM/selenodomain-associated transferase 2